MSGDSDTGPEAVTESRFRDSLPALTMLYAVLALVIGSVTPLNVALPAIGRSTDAAQGELTWIADAYAVTFASLLLPAGALGDRWGRRRMLRWGLTLFALASAAAPGVAGPHTLMGLRAVAGLGAALAMPATLSLITGCVPEKDQDRAVGLWAGVATIGGALGVIFAGAVLEVADWTAVFYASAGTAAVLCLICGRVPESLEGNRARFDGWGATSSAGAVGCVVLGVSEAPAHGWGSVTVWTYLAGGTALALVFVAVELRHSHPLLDIGIFRSRAVLIGAITLTALFAVTFAWLFVIMQYLQLIQLRSALGSGLAVLPMAATIIPLSLAAPPLVVRFGLRAVTVVGLVPVLAACLLLANIGPGRSWQFLASVLLLGASLGICVAPAPVAILQSVPDAKKGVASAVNDATREVGTAIGIAVAGTLLATGYAQHIGSMRALPEPARTQTRASLAGAIEAVRDLGTAGPPVLAQAQSAFLSAVHLVFYALAVCVVITAVVSALVAPGRAGLPNARGKHRAAPRRSRRTRAG